MIEHLQVMYLTIEKREE